MSKCDKSNDFKGVFKGGSQNRRKKGEIKWQNAVPLQNFYNFADNIGLINYYK